MNQNFMFHISLNELGFKDFGVDFVLVWYSSFGRTIGFDESLKGPDVLLLKITSPQFLKKSFWNSPIPWLMSIRTYGWNFIRQISHSKPHILRLILELKKCQQNLVDSLVLPSFIVNFQALQIFKSSNFSYQLEIFNLNMVMLNDQFEIGSDSGNTSANSSK